MAITQQLARCSQEVIDRCRADADVLHQLVNTYDLVPREDQVDLNWFVWHLRTIASVHGPVDLLSAIDEMIGEGCSEVNPAYREHPDGIFLPGEPITAMSAARSAQVAEVVGAHLARGWPSPDVVAVVGPSYADDWRRRPGRIAHELADWGTTAVTFLQQAAAHDLWVVQWKD